MARRSILAYVGAACIAAGALSSVSTFVAPGASALRGHATGLRAEGETSGESMALVKVTDESKIVMSGVMSGFAGLLIGGNWVGAGLFVAGAYLAKKDDGDVARALKGVAAGGLEALNFGAYVNDKYSVTGKIGSAFNDAMQGKSSQGAREYVDSFVTTVQKADKEASFLGTFGKIATSGADLATQAVDKVITINDEYKLTDQLKEKIQGLTDGSKSSSSKA